MFGGRFLQTTMKNFQRSPQSTKSDDEIGLSTSSMIVKHRPMFLVQFWCSGSLEHFLLSNLSCWKYVDMRLWCVHLASYPQKKQRNGLGGEKRLQTSSFSLELGVFNGARRTTGYNTVTYSEFNHFYVFTDENKGYNKTTFTRLIQCFSGWKVVRLFSPLTTLWSVWSEVLCRTRNHAQQWRHRVLEYTCTSQQQDKS